VHRLAQTGLAQIVKSGAHAFFIAQFEGFRAAANIVYGYGFELIQKNLAGGFDDRATHLPHKPAVRRLVRIPMDFARYSAQN